MYSPAILSVAPWEYRELSAVSPEPEARAEPAEAPDLSTPLRFSDSEVALRIEAALAEAREQWNANTQAEQRLAEDRLARQLTAFDAQRQAYFRQAESEVVHLVLGIARKILQREAALDPALLSGLVRVAMDRMATDTAARLRVPPEAFAAWQRAQAQSPALSRLELVADPALEATACTMEAGAATAFLNLEAQLKEIEQSFLDLMAVRPGQPSA